MKKSTLNITLKSAKGSPKANILKHTMRKFDAQHLSPIKKFTPRQIKNIRAKEKLSQPVFAAYLNISASTIKKWETGEKHPQGAALKLLNVIAKKGLAVIA